jgi:hypothetical protein
VRSAPREAGAIFAAGETAARCSVNRRRCPADEQSQRRIVDTLLLTLAQRIRVDRAEHRTPGWIDHRDDDLQAAWRVENDSLESGAGTGHADQITRRSGVHQRELTGRKPDTAGLADAARGHWDATVKRSTLNDTDRGPLENWRGR